jgi:hypothetical protein
MALTTGDQSAFLLSGPPEWVAGVDDGPGHAITKKHSCRSNQRS